MNRAVTVLSMLILALVPAQTRADIFAAVNVAAPPPRTDFDIAIVNVSLGTRVSLPSSVNTTAFEVHPSISADGRRLVFQRFGGSDGIRLLLVDTLTGDSADLFTIPEIAASPIFNSTITKDGTRVLTGRRLRASQLSGVTRFQPEATVTDVSTFPTGPYPRSTRRPPLFFSRAGSVTHVAVGGNTNDITVFRVLTGATGLGQLVSSRAGRAALLSSETIDYGHPAVNARDSSNFFTAYFDLRTFSSSNGTFGDSNVGLRLADPLSFAGPPLAGLVNNTSADESQPALSETGRYVAWVRHGADGHDRLFAREQGTLTILNPNGVDLGVVATRGIGSVSLYERAVLTASRITTTGFVTATLTSASSIGILVQRIIGTTMEHGHKRYELEPVGRVPLGFFHTGKLATQWDLAVGGEPLPPGRYLVTLRAVEGDVVRELGESRVLRIGKKGSPKGGSR